MPFFGKIRKSLVCLIGSWEPAAVIIIYPAGSIITFGLGLVGLFPLFFMPLLLNMLIIYDVCLIAKGRKSKLPEF